MFDVRRSAFAALCLPAFVIRHWPFDHDSSLYDSRFTGHDSRALRAPMHLDFANALSLVSTVTLIGAL
jgi:hypothetical protein